MQNKKQELTFNQREAAECAGVTERTLRHWNDLLNPPPCTPGRRGKPAAYPAQAFISWLVDFRIAALVEDGDTGAALDLETERTRLTAAQADRQELALQREKGSLIPADLVLSTWQALVANARAKLLHLPTRVAPEVVAATSLPEIQEAVRKLVYEALNELADDGLPETVRESHERYRQGIE